MNVCVVKKKEKEEEEQEEIIKLSLFVYTLEYTRPCASVQSVCIVNVRVLYANSGMSIRHTHNMLFETQKRRRGKEREKK